MKPLSRHFRELGIENVRIEICGGRFTVSPGEDYFVHGNNQINGKPPALPGAFNLMATPSLVLRKRPSLCPNIHRFSKHLNHRAVSTIADRRDASDPRAERGFLNTLQAYNKCHKTPDPGGGLAGM
jgi:hypothetical protein